MDHFWNKFSVSRLSFWKRFIINKPSGRKFDMLMVHIICACSTFAGKRTFEKTTHEHYPIHLSIHPLDSIIIQLQRKKESMVQKSQINFWMYTTHRKEWDELPNSTVLPDFLHQPYHLRISKFLGYKNPSLRFFANKIILSKPSHTFLL